MTWPPPAPGAADTRREITDITTGRVADPRHELRLTLWRIIYPLCTSAGWRRLRDTELDAALDEVERAYRAAP